MRASAALLLLIGSCSSALATIKVCNEFEHPIHVAIAYETSSGWVSESWLTVKANACETDTKHTDLTSFYYRGETDAVGSKKWTWGKGQLLSYKDGSFKFQNADTKGKGARLEEYSGPDSFKLPTTTVTLTFLADLRVSFFTPNENPAPSEGTKGTNP